MIRLIHKADGSLTQKDSDFRVNQQVKYTGAPGVYVPTLEAHRIHTIVEVRPKSCSIRDESYLGSVTWGVPNQFLEIVRDA